MSHACSGIEVVITGLTRNQFGRKPTWVRIPPSPPNRAGTLARGCPPCLTETKRRFEPTEFAPRSGANSVGSPSEKAVLYPRVRRDNESSAEPYTVGEARQISPSPRVRLLLRGTSRTPSPTGYAAVSFSKRKRGLVEPSENKHIDLNDGLGFAPRAPLPAPLLASGLIIPYSVRFVNRPFKLTIKRTVCTRRSRDRNLQ